MENEDNIIILSRSVIYLCTFIPDVTFCLALCPDNLDPLDLNMVYFDTR